MISLDLEELFLPVIVILYFLGGGGGGETGRVDDGFDCVLCGVD